MQESDADPTSAQPLPTDSASPGRTIRRSAYMMVAGAIAQGVTGLVFHGLAARQLFETDYGTLATFLALLLMLTVPIGAIQVAVAAARSRQPETDPSSTRRRFLLGAGAVGLASFTVAAPIGHAVHLPSTAHTAMLVPFVAIAILVAFERGLRIGEERLGRVAASIAVGGIARVAIGLPAIAAFGLWGALWATLAAEVLAYGIAWKRSHGSATLVITLPRVGRSAAIIGGLWLFTGIDMLLARHHLGADGAVGYVAAATIARTSLAVPVAIIMAALASFASPDRREARAALINTGWMVAAWGLAATVVVAAAPDLVQNILFGSVLADRFTLICLTAVAGLGGLVTLCTYQLDVRDHPASLLPWIGAGLEVALISLFHGSEAAIIGASAVALIVVLLPQGGAAWSSTRPDLASSDGERIRLDPKLRRPQHSRGDNVPVALRAGVETDLSVVIPFYNPGSSVGTTVDGLCRELDAAGVDFEVITVSDGSTDGSEEHIRAIDDPRVRLIVQPRNGGKGSALVRGFSEARGRYIGFIDADGDIAPHHLVGYLDEIRSGGDIVYASKRHAASTSFSSPLRKVVSAGFIGLTKAMFRLGVEDTQTGCKVMRREVLQDVLPLLREQRFALDLELFVVARRRGHLDHRAAAVHLGERLAGSTVTTKAIARTLRDMMAIWTRLRFSQAYPAPARVAPVVAVEPILVREPVAA